jgi:hypothetical protein
MRSATKRRVPPVGRIPVRTTVVLVSGLICLAAHTRLTTNMAAQGRVAPVHTAEVVFRDVTKAAGLDIPHINGASPEKHFVEIMGSGGLFFDYDNDGRIDVFLVDGGSLADPKVDAQARHRLHRNRGNGTFDDVTERSGIRHRDYGMGACAADYDNDGWTDLYITNFGPTALYRNTGDGRFVEVPKAGGADSPLWSTSCAFADFDRDGYLDLFVTNYVNFDRADNRFCGTTRPKVRAYCHPIVYDPLSSALYRNTGNGGFVDVSRSAGITSYRGNGLGVDVTDVDDDGLPDVFVANDGVPNFLFRNEGNWRFKEIGLLAGVSVAADGKARAGMGTAFGDYDGDGRLDLVVTNHESEMHSLFRSLGAGIFADVTLESGLGPPTLPFVGFGVVFFDYDNDTTLDLAIVNGNVVDNIAAFRPGSKHAQRKLLLRNVAGRFKDVTAHAGPAFARETVSRALARGDIDNDGDLDLLITNNGGAPTLLLNESGSRNNALVVRTLGRQGNRDGVGARLRLTVGSRTFTREVRTGSSYLTQNDLRVHFGLERATKAERLEIRWPGGRTEVLQNLPANHVITVREGGGVESLVPFVR